MARFGPIGVWFLAAMSIVMGATAASAAQQSVAVSGVSTGPGMIDIIIEDFKGPSAALYEISVPIPAGSSASNTTVLLWQELRDQLPATYEVLQGAECVRVIGPFHTFVLNETVPGQEIFLTEEPCAQRVSSMPDLGPAPTSAIVMLLGITGATLLRRRRFV